MQIGYAPVNWLCTCVSRLSVVRWRLRWSGPCSRGTRPLCRSSCLSVCTSLIPMDIAHTDLFANWYGNYIGYLLYFLWANARRVVAGFINRVRRLRGVFHLNCILSELYVIWQVALTTVVKLECARSLIGNVNSDIWDVEGVDWIFQVRRSFCVGLKGQQSEDLR